MIQPSQIAYLGKANPVDNVKDYIAAAVTDALKNITGYDATKTQILKNISGTLTWVDEEA